MSKKITYNKESELPDIAITKGDMLFNKTSSWRNIKPVIDYDLCIKCMICWKYCPEISIDIEDDRLVINYDYCKGCGICWAECPKKAIRMEEEEK